MTNYSKYKYIYPPRPKNALPPKDLDFLDNGKYMVQPKLNGSNCTIYTNGIEVYVMNRHNEKMSNFNIPEKEILNLHVIDKGKWIVLNGEYLNKGTKDENGTKWVNKLILFDILVFNDQYLIGETFKTRIELLENIYGRSLYNGYLYNISDHVKMVKTYESNFKNLFDELIKIDMYEGLVIKLKKAKLKRGNRVDNNSNTQAKSRKPTKNYKF